MTSREIFNEYGEPMDEETRERAEEEARVRFVEQSKADQEPLNEFLEQVDFEVLQNIFEDRLRDLDVDTDDLNFLGPDRIFQPERPLAVSSSPLGQYFVAENLIAIDRTALENEYGTEYLKLATLNVLCHEEIHALSRVECEIFDYVIPSSDDTVRRKPQSFARRKDVGYQKAGQTETGQLYVFYRLLNEGVTEKLAREILEEYVEHTRWSNKDDVQEYKQNQIFKSREHPSEYQVAIDFIDIFLSAIHRETGVPEDVIWKALIKGEFEGENMDDPELQEAFIASFGSGFVTKIKHASRKNMEDFITVMLLGNKVEDKKGFLETFVEKLNF